jgi:integration host factor subunit beta
MIKSQLIEILSERWTTVTKEQAEKIIDRFFDTIAEALRKGDKVEIRGFGSFRLRHRRAKDGRNPKSGQTVAVPAKKVPFFKASKELKQLLNEGLPESPASNHPEDSSRSN